MCSEHYFYLFANQNLINFFLQQNDLKNEQTDPEHCSKD